jgi:uncharacterized protein YacL
MSLDRPPLNPTNDLGAAISPVRNLPMLILRLVFIAVAAGVATLFVRSNNQGPEWIPYPIFGGVILLALSVIAIDVWTPRKRIEVISAIYFGLLVGILLTYLLSVALTPLLQDNPNQGNIQLLLAAVLCYGCISLLIQTKDDFRFVIPYVEFARDLKGRRPLILDTSSVIDGRLADLADTAILDSQLIMPRFVLVELQAIADSQDRLRRVRGRRGLDILNQLRSHERIDFQMYDRDLPEFAGQSVDMKLVLLAKQIDGKIVTGDYNLNKVAKLHNVDVINLNEIANALRPQYMPGESFQVRVVKPGEGHDQGVGYLDDGTMVVVEGGRDRIGSTVPVMVTTTYQTNAGRMIFTKIDEESRANT